MSEISTELIYQAVYNLCFKANTCVDKTVYDKIYEVWEKENDVVEKKQLSYIMQNAKIAYDEKMPLCQDTGQVLVFLNIGQNVHIKGDFIEDVVNCAVENCYNDNFFRKSVVKNAVFDRTNTKTNTPCIIYTKLVQGDEISVKVLIKGAGSENKSKLEMMLPTASEDEIVEKCAKLILEAQTNACPPMFVGIGIGGTSDKAMIVSKEALISDDFSANEIQLAERVKNKVEKLAQYKNYVLDVKLKTMYTHIACMPVAVTINCHSDRFSEAVIEKEKISYKHKIPEFKDTLKDEQNIKEYDVSNIEGLEKLKTGDKIYLTGELYVARDMAHKKLDELMQKGENLPFDLKDKIILYAGPCPTPTGKVMGSIGPTTSGRMDKYAVKFYEKGVYATIGKGTRNSEVTKYIKENNKRYFTVIGGIAALLAKKIVNSEIVAFEELGAEAVYKIYVNKLPVTVSI